MRQIKSKSQQSEKPTQLYVFSVENPIRHAECVCVCTQKYIEFQIEMDKLYTIYSAVERML